MLAALSAIAALACVGVRAAVPITPLSLIPPFSSVNSEGDRVLSDWNWGGMTEIKNNYLRLTTDRANRRGYVWGKNPVSLDKFTTTLRFRVSGQGKILFGDGFAFWVTQDQYHKDGNVHGYTDKFTGFGIVFDTFVNRESAGTHKDISLIINDGTRSVESPHGGAMVANDDPGCSGDFRYYEKRADFNAAESKSVAKITVDATRYPATVTVALDAKNTGDFKTCIDNAPLTGLPDGWHRTARLGVTASTGQLADNHDIVSLLTAEGDELLPEKAGGGLTTAQTSTGTRVVDDAIRSAVSREGARLEARLDSITHEMEHHLHAVYERLENTVGKLKEQEQGLERRLRELEDRLAEKVAGQVEQKVDERVSAKVDDKVGASIAEHVERGIQDKTGDIERRLQSQIDRHQQTTQQQSSMQSQDITRKINSLTDQLKQTAQEEASKALQGQGGLLMWVAIAVLLVGVVVAIYLSCAGGGGRGGKGRRYVNPGGGLPGLGSAVKTKPV